MLAIRHLSYSYRSYRSYRIAIVAIGVNHKARIGVQGLCSAAAYLVLGQLPWCRLIESLAAASDDLQLEGELAIL